MLLKTLKNNFMRGKRTKILKKITQAIFGSSPTISQFRRVKKDYVEHKIRLKLK